MAGKSTAVTETDPSAAFKDALDKSTGGGRDLDAARVAADKYIAAHPEQFNDYVNMNEHDLAKAADVFRAAGMDDVVDRIEMWVRSKFEPQQIGGQVEATRRDIPGFDK